MLDYRNKRFLLSVQHAVNKSSNNWVALLGDDGRNGMEYYKPANFNFVGEIVRDSGIFRDIDFCYAEVLRDLVANYQFITPRGISDEKPRHIFHSALADVPNYQEIYAFSGKVNAEMHGSSSLVTETHVFPGLRYEKTEGEFHFFRLPVPHPGHDHFKGCSGAPIVDRKKKVVALLCGGDVLTNMVRGVSLARYKFAFDFLCERST